jgi:hypothetical protein
MNVAELDIETRLEVVRLLDAIDVVRQVAHQTAAAVPELAAWAVETQALYEKFAAAIGAKTKPVFDENEHIRKRVAEGHPDFELYERSHSAPTSPPQGRGPEEEETTEEAVERLLGDGWDFTARQHAWSDHDDRWREEIGDVMAYNLGPGETIKKRGGRRSGKVQQVLVGPEGELTFLVEGMGMVRGEYADDARDLHHFWGMVVVDHADDSIYAVEPAKYPDDPATVWRIDGDPERPFMHAYAAKSRRELILNIFEDVGGGCLLGEFAILRSPEDVRSAVLVLGLDVERASRNDEDVALSAIAEFESSAPASAP